jgi:hypothetical protein
VRPAQDLLCYVNYIASQKVADSPELMGMFSETALQAIAVIVEELVRDMFETWNTSQKGWASAACRTLILTA